MTYTSGLKSLTSGVSALCLMAGVAQADIVHLDDVIIQFSLCVGNDCVNGESFGFDTIRMKENNIRLHFDDTSTSASFPRNDWRLIANDSSNGGDSYLAIEDSTAGRQVFRVDAGAPANSLRVDSAGDVGIGTSNPVVDLHVVSGNTPTLRLEQNGSQGFTAQTWDLAGNEANFFVRDVTNGSSLSFRIRPGAPESSIDIAGSGDVGMGTSSPSADLHIREASSSAGNQTLLLLDNVGGRPRIEMLGAGNAGQTGNWSLSAGNTFVLQDRTNNDNEMTIDQSGNMTILGALTQNSDKRNKMAIEPVDTGDILARVNQLEVSAWTYKNDAPLGIRHIGPMAQDFYALFGTGANENGISTIDTAGVALAAIQALSVENAALKARLDQLETRIQD